ELDRAVQHVEGVVAETERRVLVELEQSGQPLRTSKMPYSNGRHAQYFLRVDHLSSTVLRRRLAKLSDVEGAADAVLRRNPHDEISRTLKNKVKPLCEKLDFKWVTFDQLVGTEGIESSRPEFGVCPVFEPFREH